MMRGPPAQGSSFKFGANNPKNMNSKSFGPAGRPTKLRTLHASCYGCARGLHAMQLQIVFCSQTQIGEAVLPWRKLAQASDKQTSRHTDRDIHDEPNGGQIVQNNFLYVAARSAAHRRRRWGPLGPPAPGDPSLHLTARTRMFYALDSRNTDVL